MDSFEQYEQKPDKAPFKEWKDSDLQGFSSELFSLPDHPELVIRNSVTLPDKGNIMDMVDFWSGRAKDFRNFAEKYGIKMAKTSYFVGSDPKFKTNIPKEASPMFMAATERIDGKNLSALNEINEKAEKEIDALFSGLFSALYDASKENGYSWEDYGNGQVMYGTAPGEKEQHVYIVDVDPLMTNWETIPRERKDFFFWTNMNWIFKEMEELEKRVVNKSKKFQSAHEILSKIISEMPEPADDKAKELRFEIINSKK
ncbi:MAG: hypothetical protein NTZ13_04470 [Candidatus Parcubacteria bacterium]|nr:hypothetical protein [Candidatus Parcubacteria bacterium]